MKLFIFFVLVMTQSGFAQEETSRMDWFCKARFGLFIHWGPVSLKGTEIGWSRMGERRGRKTPTRGIPAEVYDNLYKSFNPTEFDADQWVNIAQNAGMKYLVFTTKHHDGFVNFDSKLIDYKITSKNSPYGKDIVAALVKACNKAGMRIGFYYSQPDWFHKDYRTKDHKKYIAYLHGQIEELLTQYGKIDILWFDGLGGKPEDWDAQNLFKKIKALQPRIIINNRCGLPGDFDTPEQRIGAFHLERPWETCMTICRQWAWKPNDKLKSFKECIQTLVRVVGGDGNLLFNVGPMPNGRFEERQTKRLLEMGQWLQKYGDSIYRTRGGPYTPESWGVSTRKDTRIFLHVLNWEDEILSLPPIQAKVKKITCLTGGEAQCLQTDKGLRIRLAQEHRSDINTILVLHLDKEAIKIKPLSRGALSFTHKKPAKASNVFQNNPAYGPDKAVDNNPHSRWATDAGTKTALLEVDLGDRVSFNRAKILEAYAGRVKRYALQYKEEDEWITFFEGAGLNDNTRLKFKTQSARRVRLNIFDASEGPTIYEFQLFFEDGDG